MSKWIKVSERLPDFPKKYRPKLGNGKANFIQAHRFVWLHRLGEISFCKLTLRKYDTYDYSYIIVGNKPYSFEAFDSWAPADLPKPPCLETDCDCGGNECRGYKEPGLDELP